MSDQRHHFVLVAFACPALGATNQLYSRGQRGYFLDARLYLHIRKDCRRHGSALVCSQVIHAYVHAPKDLLVKLIRLSVTRRPQRNRSVLNAAGTDSIDGAI